MAAPNEQHDGHEHRHDEHHEHEHHHKDIVIQLINEGDHKEYRLHGRADTHVRAVIAEAYKEMNLTPHEHDRLWCKGSGGSVFDHVGEEIGRYVEHHCQAHEWLFKAAKEIIYFVNGEAEKTTERELTVGFILENAGFTPKTDYTLKREHPPKDYGSDYEEKVEIHQDEHFRARAKGPTPTS
jgi:hypothetical protein